MEYIGDLHIYVTNINVEMANNIHVNLYYIFF